MDFLIVFVSYITNLIKFYMKSKILQFFFRCFRGKYKGKCSIFELKRKIRYLTNNIFMSQSNHLISKDLKTVATFVV